jgi:hypothetical protein
MNKRYKNTKIGDIFSVAYGDNCKRFLQLIAYDSSQLNSDVVRVFKKIYTFNEIQNLNVIVKDQVDFYAHCDTKAGMKLGCWNLEGNNPDVGDLDKITFRTNLCDTRDPICYSWFVWYLNREPQQVSKISGIYRKSDIGSVLPPQWIVERIITGEYHFVYPDFE